MSIKIARKLKFYVKIIISKVKVSKRAKKCWKKPQIGLKTRFPKFFYVLANLK